MFRSNLRSPGFVGGIVNTQPAARERLEAFANKTAARVRPNS